MNETAYEHGITHADIIRGKRVVLCAGNALLPTSGVVGLIGINGAGKSTLMLAIADLLRRAGRSHPDIVLKEYPQAIGFAPQRPVFPSWLTTLEIVRMFGFDYDDLQASLPSLLLEELRGIRGDRLSAGQSQALSVALALHSDTAITLLDEPFAPLDFRRRIALTDALRLRRHPQECNRLTFVSTQSALELVDVCDWMIVLKAGRYALSAPIRGIVPGALDEYHARREIERIVLEILA